MKAAIEGLATAHAAGVRIGHGSDLEGILHPYQSREFLHKAEVMTPHEVIVAATATNAEIIGMKGQLGCIAPGALADLRPAALSRSQARRAHGRSPARLALTQRTARIYKHDPI